MTEPNIEGAFQGISSGAGILWWFTYEAATFFDVSYVADKLALTCGIISSGRHLFIRPRVRQEGTASSAHSYEPLNLMFQPNLLQPVLLKMSSCLDKGNSRASRAAVRPKQHGNRLLPAPARQSHDAIAGSFQEVTAKLARTWGRSDREERSSSPRVPSRNASGSSHENRTCTGPRKMGRHISSFRGKAPKHAT